MKLLSIYTDSIKVLKDEWFLKTLQDDLELKIKYLDEVKEGKGDFQSPEWHYSLRKKIEYIIDEIKNNRDEIIIWSDIDIQFFSKCTEIIEKAMQDRDIVFQLDDAKAQTVNSGFMAIRCNPKTLLFFETILKADFKNLRLPDQDVANSILKQRSIPLKWGYFPKQIYATYLGGVPLDIALHHACGTKEPFTKNGKRFGSIEMKIEQLKEIRNFTQLPLGWKIFHNLIREIRRLIWPSISRVYIILRRSIHDRKLLILVMAFVMMPESAYAYVDPGSGLLMWQIILSLLIGAIFQIKKIKNWLLNKINFRKEKNKE